MVRTSTATCRTSCIAILRWSSATSAGAGRGRADCRRAALWRLVAPTGQVVSARPGPLSCCLSSQMPVLIFHLRSRVPRFS